jgi:hypothetical protein
MAYTRIPTAALFVVKNKNEVIQMSIKRINNNPSIQ